jgi:hypothetical protein
MDTLCIALNMSNEELRFYGDFHVIVEDARKLYLSEAVSDELATYILDYFDDNGVYPTRQKILGNKLISHYQYRQITSVLNTANTMREVIEYCKKVYI